MASKIASPFGAGANAWRDKVAGYWPRRLLHIPSMTSYERTGEKTYNGEEAPEYGMLTYTWGRWMDGKNKEAPRIKVAGIEWEIPAILAEHFTVEAFQKVIDRIGKEVKWAWIDVTVIDQRDQTQQQKAAKMEEIGNQVGIFRYAKCSFVWLSRLSTWTLTNRWKEVLEHSSKLQFHFNGDPKSTGDPDKGLLEILPPLQSSLESLFADPWFSSIWTLQEAILRNDALILSHEADTIDLKVERSEAYLAILVNYCSNIRKDLLSISERRRGIPDLFRNRAIDGLISQLLEDIHRAGLIYLVVDNPNIQYGAVQYRQTTRPLDRIYAIMQIYGLKVGEAANTSLPRPPELRELQDEFAGAICQKCPVLGQLFLHTKKPEIGDFWRITEFSSVPEDFRDYPTAIPKSKITFQKKGGASDPAGGYSRSVSFNGKSLLLTDFLKQWAQCLQESDADTRFSRHLRDLYNCLKLHLDNAATETHTTSHNSTWGPARDEVRELDLPSVLEKVPGYGDLKDTLEGSRYSNTKVSDIYILWLGTRFNEKSVVLKDRRNEVGLLARVVEGKPHGLEEGQYWERLGVVTWYPDAALGEKDTTFTETLEWKEGEMRLL